MACRGWWVMKCIKRDVKLTERKLESTGKSTWRITAGSTYKQERKYISQNMFAVTANRPRSHAQTHAAREHARGCNAHVTKLSEIKVTPYFTAWLSQYPHTSWPTKGKPAESSRCSSEKCLKYCIRVEIWWNEQARQTLASKTGFKGATLRAGHFERICQLYQRCR